MTTPTRILLDTDMLTDCDDIGALAMLHALADRGEAEILGITLNGFDSHVKHSAVVSAVNTAYGRPGVPIAVTGRGADATPAKPSSYSQEIFDEFDHDGLTDAQRPDAVELYREVLAAQPSGSVVIVSIGFLSNLADLLATDGGADLLADRVRGISIMGGDYPQGAEYNFQFDGIGPTTHYVIENLPASIPVTYTGFTLGQAVITGTAYQATPPSPMRRGYELAYDSINVGRPSWDQLALLYGVRGCCHNGREIFRRNLGVNSIAPDGSNTWRPDESSIHGYLEAAIDPTDLAATIEALMIAPPAADGR